MERKEEGDVPAPRPAHAIFQAALPSCALTFPSHAHPTPRQPKPGDKQIPGSP